MIHSKVFTPRATDPVELFVMTEVLAAYRSQLPTSQLICIGTCVVIRLDTRSDCQPIKSKKLHGHKRTDQMS